MRQRPGQVRLPIRVRRIQWRANESSRALLVQCPTERAWGAVERCRECDRCDGLVLAGGQAEAVLCRSEPTPAPPRRIMPTAAEVTPIAALLGDEVVCVGATLSLADATALLLARGLSGAPVVDDDGRPVGMLTRADLLRAFAAGGIGTVADAMTGIAFTLGEHDPLSRAAGIMAAEGVHHLPVVGDYGRVVGLVTTFDLTRWLARQAGFDV